MAFWDGPQVCRVPDYVGEEHKSTMGGEGANPRDKAEPCGPNPEDSTDNMNLETCPDSSQN